MLMRLEIRDFAVISNMVFEPSYGLNVISGETGAGKSLIVDAISLILGAKASRNLIRSSKSSCFVEACFDCSDLSAAEFTDMLNDSGIDAEDGTLIISRTVYDSGKSIARINGAGVTMTVLKEITSFLVDIHGQHDTQRIFDEKSHVALLDSYGGEELTAARENYLSHLADYRGVVTRLRQISSSPDYLDRRREYLEYVVKEIDEAGFCDGDEEKLHEIKEKLQVNEATALGLSDALASLTGDGTGRCASDGVKYAAQSLSGVSAKDSSVRNIAERANNISLELDALTQDLNRMSDDLEYDPSLKEETERRIGLLYDLKAKYGSTIKEINEFAEQSRTELSSIDDNKDLEKKLQKDRRAIEHELLDAAYKLTAKRTEAAGCLSSEIVAELSDLEMNGARFEVSFTRHEKSKFFSSSGIDDVAFRFSANPGQELRPLSSIVSGGEASRIMLAIKNILSRCDSTPTLIFDEIDTGVSGKASRAIANKLRSISEAHQVLCVTHTAQIAAGAHCNFMLSKTVSDGDTQTVCDALDYQGRIREVSRLLSGDYKDSSLNLARELCESF